MAARRYKARQVTLQTDGDVNASAVYVLYEAGTAVVSGRTVSAGTLFAGALYDNATGGSPRSPTITADATGQIEVWTETLSDYDLVVQPTSGDYRLFARESFEIAPQDQALLWTDQTYNGDKTFNETVTILGVSAGGFGGVRFNQYGGITGGRQVASGDVSSSWMAANIDGDDTDANLLMNLALNNRADGVDVAGITLTVSEGWNSAWGVPTGPASNLMTGEWRLVIGTYPALITQGHGATRTAGGFGLSTQTQQAHVAGLHATEEVGVKVDCDGRSAFPALLPDGVTPNPNANGVPGGTAVLTMGYTGWYFHLMGSKVLAGGLGTPTDPLYALDEHARFGLWILPTAQLHVRRNSNILGGTDPIAIVEGDHTGNVNLLIRGGTDNAKRLRVAYDTTNNRATLDAQTTGAAAASLMLNTTGGSVYLAADPSGSAIGGGAGRLVVKQLAETGANDGITVAKSGTSPQQAFSMTVDSSGLGTLTAQLPGTSNATLKMGPTTSDITVDVNAPAAQAADLLRLRVNTTEKFAVTPTGSVEISGVQMLAATRGAAVASVATADADATYGAEERDLINEIKAQFNTLLARLRPTAGHGLIEA